MVCSCSPSPFPFPPLLDQCIDRKNVYFIKIEQSELNLLKRLENKYITKYIGFVKEEQFLYIVLEFIEGGSLSAILKKFGGTKEPLCARYVAQTLIGLDYLHRRRVVHRDIKWFHSSFFPFSFSFPLPPSFPSLLHSVRATWFPLLFDQ